MTDSELPGKPASTAGDACCSPRREPVTASAQSGCSDVTSSLGQWLAAAYYRPLISLHALLPRLLPSSQWRTGVHPRIAAGRQHRVNIAAVNGARGLLGEGCVCLWPLQVGIFLCRHRRCPQRCVTFVALALAVRAGTAAHRACQ